MKKLFLFCWMMLGVLPGSVSGTAERLPNVHPLRLSLCEVEHVASERKVRVALKLFLMDIEDALLLDQGVENQRYCTSQEDRNADRYLVQYLQKYFALKVNGREMPLIIREKKLKGEGDNEALWCLFEFTGIAAVNHLTITNKVFTELFYDQSNVIYIHIGDDSRSLMLNIETPSHRLEF